MTHCHDVCPVSRDGGLDRRLAQRGTGPTRAQRATAFHEAGHAVVLFQPDHRILITADALWANGFGVVFPELDGEPGFAEVDDTLRLIESLAPEVVIPGHGSVFGGAIALSEALRRARSRLDQFRTDPARHRRHALKVLIKFKLLEWQQDVAQRFLGPPVGSSWFPLQLPLRSRAVAPSRNACLDCASAELRWWTWPAIVELFGPPLSEAWAAFISPRVPNTPVPGDVSMK